MLVDVIEVKYLTDYKLFLRFEDGIEGEVDISEIVPFKGVFAKLADKNFFSGVKLNTELGTIFWENGADIAPKTLHDFLTQSLKK